MCLEPKLEPFFMFNEISRLSVLTCVALSRHGSNCWSSVAWCSPALKFGYYETVTLAQCNGGGY